MEKVLFLDSPMKEKPYGGDRIQKQFGIGHRNKRIGEYWIISAYDNGLSIIRNGVYKGRSLKQAYADHREWFDHDTNDKFPLLVKINEVRQPVSVQVHPGDAYAEKHENDAGKAEFCLWLDVEEGTKIIRGHTARTKEAFRKAIEQKKWDTLLIRKPVKTDDFVYTPPGVVHGIEGKLMMAEVQQSSDVTYRIYDYGRKDDQGRRRELHIDQACEVTTIPHVEPEISPVISMENENECIKYVDTNYFRVSRYKIKNEVVIPNDRYSLCAVLQGSGMVTVDHETYDIQAGIGFIVTSNNSSYKVTGKLDLLISEPPKKAN